jgi:hypothetical protein
MPILHGKINIFAKTIQIKKKYLKIIKVEKVDFLFIFFKARTHTHNTYI